MSYLWALTLLAITSFADVGAELKADQLLDPFFSVSTLEQRNKKIDYNWNGIVKFEACSGALIRFEGHFNKDRKALVMTNGHCLLEGDISIWNGRAKMIAPDQQIKRAKEYQGNKKVTLFGGVDHKPVVDIETKELVYATMEQTDLAIYKLKATYRQIEKYGITPLVVAKERAPIGTEIDILSGYWVDGFSCSIDKIVYQQREMLWTWDDAIRYNKIEGERGCPTYGGTSGSPIIERSTRKIIGINNTSNEDGEACTIMNPCEIDKEGLVTVQKSRSYGQQVNDLYGCLTKLNTFNFRKKTCKLPKYFRDL